MVCFKEYKNIIFVLQLLETFCFTKLLTNRAFITGDDSKYQPSAVNAGKI